MLKSKTFSDVSINGSVPLANMADLTDITVEAIPYVPVDVFTVMSVNALILSIIRSALSHASFSAS
jgi:hypothetical protein